MNEETTTDTPMDGDQDSAAFYWRLLSKVDVSDYIQTGTKGGRKFAYLPWEAAWSLLKSRVPHATFQYSPDIRHQDGSVEVEVTLIIGSYVAPPVRLAVMNQSFNAILEPDARNINDARQRCLVKAIAIGTGLGLSLWTDFPETAVGSVDDPISKGQRNKLLKVLKEQERSIESFLEWADVETVEDLPARKYNAALRMLGVKS